MTDVMEFIDSSQFFRKRESWVIIGFALVAPLSCLPSLNALRFTSTAAIVFVVFLAMLIILYACDVPGADPCAGRDDDGPCVGEKTWSSVDLGTFRVLSIFVFAFTCHQVKECILNRNNLKLYFKTIII